MIEEQFFGYTSAGEAACQYRITNRDGMTATLTDYGAALTGLILPSAGETLDVVLGYDSVASYETNKGQLGATVGRNANRLRNACFTLNGHTYELQKDRSGNNSHSGPEYYNIRIWKTLSYHKNDFKIAFLLNSPHMDQGFPGNLHLTVTYSLTDDNTLLITYDALCDQDTVLNVTNHSYFNLNGHNGKDVLSHYLQINADSITETDSLNIPTGVLQPVGNTRYDFTQERIIAEEFDTNWCLNNAGLYTLCATLSTPLSRLSMDVYTDLPGVQVYTGNALSNRKGKSGAVYGPHSGICLETQYYVNAINIPAFKQPILKADTPFQSTTGYHFSGFEQ